MKIIEPSVEHLRTTTAPLELIELAGRNCYQSETREGVTPEDFCRRIIKRGHESVLEHVATTFRIVTDRGVMAELTRHRTGVAFSIESTRYCNYKEGVKVIRPTGITDDVGRLFDWDNAAYWACENYGQMLKNGCTPQVARSVLPTCTATTIVVTANWREFRHILRLRTAPAAHPDMRVVMNMVKDWFRSEYPVVVEDIP
jgi:thymidylate synthase (FAD)